VDNVSDLENQFYVVEEIDEISERKAERKAERRAKIRSKNTLTGKYFAFLLHKEPLKCLLIIGGFIGLIVSVYGVTGGALSWWWIPLSIMFVGPIGLVFFALILPFIPYIVYIILRVAIES
jgi:hypothetical protein